MPEWLHILSSLLFEVCVLGGAAQFFGGARLEPFGHGSHSGTLQRFDPVHARAEETPSSEMKRVRFDPVHQRRKHRRQSEAFRAVVDIVHDFLQLCKR